jgi:hypothetical protein
MLKYLSLMHTRRKPFIFNLHATFFDKFGKILLINHKSDATLFLISLGNQKQCILWTILWQNAPLYICSSGRCRPEKSKHWAKASQTSTNQLYKW